MTTLRGMERKLPRKIRATPAWKHFAQAIDAVLGHNVLDPIGKAIDLRDPAKIEEFFLPRLANLLGFDMQVDYYDEDQRRKVVASLYEYWNASGTPKFQEFLRLNSPFIQQLAPLWTEDYANFVRYPSGKTVYEDPVNGTWFLTPHFEIYVDGLETYQPNDFSMTGMLGTERSQLGKLFLGHGKRDILTFDDLLHEEFLVNLFYDLAPVHLVLERITRGYVFEGRIYTMGLAALETYTGREKDLLIPFVSLLDVDYLVDQDGVPDLVVPTTSFDVFVDLDYQAGVPTDAAPSTLFFTPDFFAVSEDETVANFSLSLYPALPNPIEVTYETIEGTAVEGTDFVRTAGVTTMLPGQTLLTISVPLVPNNQGISRDFTLRVLPVASLGSPGDLIAKCEIRP